MSFESRVTNNFSFSSSLDSGLGGTSPSRKCFRGGTAEDKRRVWQNFKEEVLDRLAEDDQLEERFKSLKILGTASRRSSSTETSTDEVSAFQAFLVSHGGHTGTWDVDEHAKFVNVFSKCAGEDEGKLMMRLTRALPARNCAEISQHITWYKEYCARLEAKREALQRWRAAKKAEKSTDPSEDSKKSSRVSPDPTQLEAEQKRRSDVKEKLRRWKEEKALEEVAKQREMQEKIAESRAPKDPVDEATRESIRRTRRMRLEILRQQKEEKDRLEREVRRLRGKLANKAASEYRERDLRDLRGKIIMRAASEEEKAERTAKIISSLKKQVPVSAERDPNRVKQPTMAALCRQYSIDKCPTGVLSGPVMNVRKISHRGTPAWRAELKGS